MAENHIQRIIAHHTRPSDAGLIFSKTKAKLAVYTHLVLLASERIPPPTVDDLVAETRRTYGGPLVIGEDLMSFDIGDTVTVRRYQPDPRRLALANKTAWMRSPDAA